MVHDRDMGGGEVRNRVPTVRVLGQRRDVGERGSREHNKGIWLFREEEDGWGDLGEELHLVMIVNENNQAKTSYLEDTI